MHVSLLNEFRRDIAVRAMARSKGGKGVNISPGQSVNGNRWVTRTARMPSMASQVTKCSGATPAVSQDIARVILPPPHWRPRLTPPPIPPQRRVREDQTCRPQSVRYFELRYSSGAVPWAGGFYISTKPDCSR